MLKLNKKKLINRTYIGLILLLSACASFIIGLISFGFFLDLWPIASIATAILILSLVYEGEIYFHNIKAALDKLLQSNYIKLDLAHTYLLNYFPQSVPRTDWPKFFRQYERLLQRQYHLRHLPPTETIRIKKKAIERKLNDMEHEFSELLAHLPPQHPQPSLPSEHQALHAYLMQPPPQSTHDPGIHSSLLQKYQETLKKRRLIFRGIRVFSLLMILFMAFGTTYLLAMSVSNMSLPFGGAILRWSTLILPLAIITGFAYGLLIFNTFANIVTHDVLLAWYHRFTHEIRQNGFTLRNMILMISALVLSVLSICLTCFSAGAWWGIIIHSRPVFFWMTKIPKWLMAVFLPLMTSISTLLFNIENTSESLDVITEITQDNHLDGHHMLALLRNEYKALRRRENMLQLLNPFRLLLAISVTPLRIFLFWVHTISLGVASPRTQRTPMWTAIVSMISKGFVDPKELRQPAPSMPPDTMQLLAERMKNKRQNRKHDVDLPTRIILYLAFPFYLLAAVWDYLLSQWNKHPYRLSFKQAFQKQWILHKDR